MRVLALETSTEYCSCALWIDGVVEETMELARQRHSALLLPMTVALMARTGTAFDDLDAVAFGAGPGSFTGLRIACSVAQGIAFARDLPVLPVGTLKALAEDAGGPLELACLDARMGELYLAAYAAGEHGWRTVQEPVLVGPERLPALEGIWHGCGTGFSAHAAALAAAYRLSGSDPLAVPRAGAIARLAARDFAAGGGIAAERAAPVYLRDKVALNVEEQAAARAARAVT